LAGLGCVDWVVPFSGADPGGVIKLLKPEVLVKGPDYAGKRVVGDETAKETLIAPEGPHTRHCTDLIAAAKVI
jgi:bifunctional ADP-heptose synthase (sugar kinase/adenylyltransferase)